MSDVVVRLAAEEELAAVGELSVAAFEADGYLDGGRSDPYAAVLADASARWREADLLVAVDGDGVLLGTVTFAMAGSRYAQLAEAGEAEFRVLAVGVGARGRGVGELLTRAVIGRARELGASGVVLSSLPEQRRAHRIYERLGFRRVADRDWSPRGGVELLAFVLGLG
ncbi:L-amino acid N-acyltransferase YncA [Herbihabitans rhizosphaerae]|uniref:L-amino acid N-acyltransferase YncA n=1 Tax=Herbihabitans rhizosphaerae TaxID=1872711 RepID=A0A4Q7KRN5_9PSEU|nr:GNAT family N-acetyltransferase [Herbihabitans rhizosphaerae]RZS39066.1 L-amino acid N-acyltransferase YncA [Herbihabitans rhizosphaerae]